MRIWTCTIALVVMASAPLPLLSQSKTPPKTPPPASAAKAAPAAPVMPAAPAAATVLVDINRATKTELEAIPGIGAAYSAKIIAGRPYANKLQLTQKKILPQGVYDKVKDRLIAKQ